MKKSKIISLIISVLILFSSFSAYAAAFPPQDSLIWKNLTSQQADKLINNKTESFIFFFYRDNCINSKNSMTKLFNYASENNLAYCGVNANEYPTWMTWSKFLAPGESSIGFPMVIVYNKEYDLISSADEVFTVEEFEELLGDVNMLPDSSTNASARSVFKDVPKKSEYYEAIRSLSSEGVLSGYEDGTFKPDNSINRAEAAAVIVRAAGLEIQSSKKSTYTDVSDSFWGKDYIMAASQAGIINGMGDGLFAPQNNLTRIQIIKMLVCMVGLEETALENGGWPNGYAKAAYDNAIIDSDTYDKFTKGSYSNDPATRGQVAQWTFNSRYSNKGASLVVAGKTYELGMPSLALDTPDEICPSVNNFDWYVYGTKTYEDFVAVGVANEEVVALVSTGPAFEYQGYRAGDILGSAQKNADEFLTDKNDKNIIHGVFIYNCNYTKASTTNDKTLKAESKMNFHCTNGFRLYHNKSLLIWDELAAQAATLHSADMATNDYFNHTAKDGSSPAERMRRVGIELTKSGENIFAGLPLGVLSYDNWINSKGHRENILSDFDYLGVGTAYNPDSTYTFYSTQNFYSKKYGNAFDSFFAPF